MVIKQGIWTVALGMGLMVGVSVHAGDSEGILAGPSQSVDENHQKDSSKGFAGGKAPKADVTVSAMAEPLGLTEEQKEAMRRVSTMHMAESSAYRAKHLEEYSQLRVAKRKALADKDEAGLKKVMDREIEIAIGQPTREQLVKRVRETLNDDQQVKYLWLLWQGRGNRAQVTMVIYDLIQQMELEESEQAKVDAVLLAHIRKAESYMESHHAELVAFKIQGQYARDQGNKAKAREFGKKQWEIRKGSMDRDQLREALIQALGPENARELRTRFEEDAKKEKAKRVKREKSKKNETQLDL